jgi:hypothetical protein
MDESGDLGFDFTKQRTSKYFVVTLLFVPDSKGPIEKIVKKTHHQLAKSVKRKTGVLHATKEKPVTRQRLLKLLAEKDCAVMTIYLNKERVYSRLQDEKQVLYNYVTNILLDRIYTRRIIDTDLPIELIASRRETNRFFNENFCDYLTSKVAKEHQQVLPIRIATPHAEKGLQAVDFVSWAIFRKYEYGDDSYYNLIKSIIAEESPLFG